MFKGFFQVALLKIMKSLFILNYQNEKILVEARQLSKMNHIPFLSCYTCLGHQV